MNLPRLPIDYSIDIAGEEEEVEEHSWLSMSLPVSGPGNMIPGTRGSWTESRISTLQINSELFNRAPEWTVNGGMTGEGGDLVSPRA